MAQFLLQVSYTTDAWAAMVKQPQNRQEAVRPAIEALGGKVERFWMAFGDYDIVGVIDMPDSVSAAAFSMAIMAGGACKGDAQKCDTGCRNFFTLLYWKTADAEVSASPVDQRDALRKQKLGEFDRKLENGIDMCVSQCQAANNDTDIECMIAAKTADQATGCLK